MNPASERRYKVLWIPEHQVLDLLCWRDFSCLQLPVPEGLPGGVVVTDVRHCWERKAFGFRLFHPSWPVVPDGMGPPDVEGVRVEVARLVRCEGGGCYAPAKPKPPAPDAPPPYRYR